MPRYRIVAARDGDMVDATAEWPGEDVAQAWAAGLLSIEFGLDADEYDSLDAIAPETDGLSFEEVEEDKIAEAAIELLRALDPIVTSRRFEPLLERDHVSLNILCRAAALASVLVTEGYRR